MGLRTHTHTHTHLGQSPRHLSRNTKAGTDTAQPQTLDPDTPTDTHTQLDTLEGTSG